MARVLHISCCRRVSSNEGQAAGLTPQQHAAILYDQWLLDVPKLMDVCVLYGPANPALLQRFMQQVCVIERMVVISMRKRGTASPLLSGCYGD